MKIHGVKTPAAKDRAVANTPRLSIASESTLQLTDNRPATARLRALQQSANNTARTTQLQTHQSTQDNTPAIIRPLHAGMTPSVNNAVMQCMIGDGGPFIRGRIVVDRFGKIYQIVDHEFDFGILRYRIKDQLGNEKTVAANDNNYNLDTSYTGSGGFSGWRRSKSWQPPETGEKDDVMQGEDNREKEEKKENTPKKRKRANSTTKITPPPRNRNTRSNSKSGEESERSDPPVKKKRKTSTSKKESTPPKEKKNTRTSAKKREEQKKKKRRNSIKFSVARRDKGARTNTTFNNSSQAKEILMDECELPQDLVTSLVEKKDWSYPTMQQLMTELQKQGTLQPGLQEGVNLWKDSQPSFNYTIETTDKGSPLAQIVGCHLMEYQETNNGTQGVRQRKDKSRKKQLELSTAILSLPEDQAPKHSLGIGLPEHVRLFPPMFDVKFEDNKKKFFAKTAGAKTFKIYQNALSKMNPQYTIDDTLVDQARKDRRTQIKDTLEGTTFDVDRNKDLETEDYFKSELGLKDTESDNSMEEDEDWKFRYTPQKVGKWTLQKLFDYVFKHNVFSGVLYKDTGAKLAELDILENKTKDVKELKRIKKSRKRRTGVQSRVKQANDELLKTMETLGVNTVLLYQRLQQWKAKKKILDTATTTNGEKKKKIAAHKKTLKTFMEMTLKKFQEDGYPPPLEGIGNGTLKSLAK